MEYQGIDVSSFQGDINWHDVANNKDFAMIRATYGTSGIDVMFETNMKQIATTNLPFGLYHYCYAMNTQEAINEAKHFINTIKPYAFYYPAALDMEEMSIAELGKEEVTDIILAFINTLRQENYYPILYADLNWLQNYINTNRVSSTEIWLSEWNIQMSYTRNVTMWQYSSDGTTPGINGRVDLNISYKDYPTVIKENGYNGTNKDIPAPHPQPNPNPDPETRIYRVKEGDTLWGIAEKYLGDGNKYREIMLLNNLTSDIIIPGQILKIPQINSNTLVLYRVRRGDTLWTIAQRFLGNGERYPEIMSENGLTSDVIYAGQLLNIPINPPSNTPVVYTVREGDTLWNISQRFLGNGNKYKEIMDLNQLSTETIYPGEQLKIPPR